jgi:hypothetical protein
MVNATIHGDELNGVEIVRQLINNVDPKKLKGTLIAVPIVNVFGFIHKSRYLPDRRDLNRCFPGSEKGSLASRMQIPFSPKSHNVVTTLLTYILEQFTERTSLKSVQI